MREVKRAAIVGIALFVLAVGCTPPQVARAPGTAPDGERAPIKRLIAAINGDAHTLVQKLNPQSHVPGIDTLEGLVNASLTVEESARNPRAQLGETVPSLQNDLWRVFPDGRMETVWTIKEGAQWHDGTPLTAEDFLLALRVGQDPDLPYFTNRAYSFVDSVEGRGARTIAVWWNAPYIEGDALFSRSVLPLPKHLLEQAYLGNKSTFLELPYWSHEFVGTGPFRLREWVGGSHVLLEAFSGYVLGRPKIDQIEVRFIPASASLMANVLAGEVELTLGRGLSIEQAVEIRGQWAKGRPEIVLVAGLAIFPQFVDANPAVVTNVQFRRALSHAINRQEIADTIQAGLVPVAENYLLPGEPEYQDTKQSFVQYAYDPSRAVQLIDALGYTRGPDGIFRDSTNQRLSVEIRASSSDLNQKTMLAIADYWQRVGVGVDPVAIPTQLARDNEYRSNFPAFYLTGGRASFSGLRNFHSLMAPTAERGFAGSNIARYRSSELDAMIDRLFITIERPARLQLVSQMLRTISEEAIWMGLALDGDPVMLGNRLKNLTTTVDTVDKITWNAHEWDIV